MQRYVIIPATDDWINLQVTEAASGPLVHAAARRNTRGAVSHALTHAVNYSFPFFPRKSPRGTRMFEVVERKEQILERRLTMRLFRVLCGLLLSSKPVTVLSLARWEQRFAERLVVVGARGCPGPWRPRKGACAPCSTPLAPWSGTANKTTSNSWNTLTLLRKDNEKLKFVQVSLIREAFFSWQAAFTSEKVLGKSNTLKECCGV